MIKVPYHKQDFWFSCFPACIRMLLEYYGIKVKEIDLRKLFGTTPKRGTEWPKVVDKIRKYGVEFVYLRNQKFEKLVGLIKEGVPVVVSVDTLSLGDFSHRAHTMLVVGVFNKKVVIHDPEKGSSIEIDKDKFLKAWKERYCRIGYIKR